MKKKIDKEFILVLDNAYLRAVKEETSDLSWLVAFAVTFSFQFLHLIFLKSP